MKVFACYSSKGGVGKTSTAVNLAYEAARNGRRTLLIDLDQQGASTFYYRMRESGKSGGGRLMKLLAGMRDDPAAGIRESDFPGLHLLPASRSYRHFDALLKGMKGSKRRLSDFVAAAGAGYDVVILDCPPTMGRLAENVFRAADRILVPVVPTTLSERTYLQLKEFFDRSGLRMKRIRPFFSMVEMRKTMHLETMARLRETEKRLLHTSVPYSAVIESMGVHRAPVGVFASKHPACNAFRRLWEEVAEIGKA